jgi:hypothetical protein
MLPTGVSLGLTWIKPYSDNPKPMPTALMTVQRYFTLTASSMR